MELVSRWIKNTYGLKSLQAVKCKVKSSSEITMIHKSKRLYAGDLFYADANPSLEQHVEVLERFPLQ